MNQFNLSANDSFGLGTFSRGGDEHFPGVVINDYVVSIKHLSTIKGSLAKYHSVLTLLDDWASALPTLMNVVESLFDEKEITTRDIFIPLRDLSVHPPVNLPRQIFCSGANYRKHVIDLIVDSDSPTNKDLSREERVKVASNIMDKRAAHGSPYMFNKIVSCITGAYSEIHLDPYSSQVDWELELAVVIGKHARNITRSEALHYVAGYTIANDLTNRDLIWCKDDLKALGSNWFLGKCSPTYLPLGPYLVPAEFISDPQNLQLVLKLNGHVMQDESTSDMIFDISRQIEFISAHASLWPGDIICTGSPAGNGTHYDRYLTAGDVLECTITDLGTMRNICV